MSATAPAQPSPAGGSDDVDFRTHTLANGLVVIAEVDPRAHTSAAGFFVRTGGRDEPTRLMGVSHFLEHMMFKGSETRRAEQVNEAFDEIGAENNAFTSHEMTAYYAHVLPEHLDRSLELLADLMRPALREEDFDEEKGVIIEEIAMYEDQPFWVLYEHALERYYRDHPLAHRVLGTRESITALGREEMASYFHDHYAADSTVLAVAGNVDFDHLVATAERLCGGWHAAKQERSLPAFVPTADDTTLTDDTLAQAYFLGIAPGPDQNDDRRWAAKVLADVLGDSDNSRLHWALVETGLADEAHASWEGRDGCGEFTTWAVCAPEKLAEVESIIEREIDDLVASLEESDLERTRARIATAAAVAGERPLGRMQRIGASWTARGACLSLAEEVARIDAVTLDDLRAVAAAFPPKPLVRARSTPNC